MPWGVAAAAGAGIVGSLISSNAATSAASTQAAAAQQAAQLQFQEFNQIQGNEQPYLNAGTNAIPALQAAIAGYGNVSGASYPGSPDAYVGSPGGGAAPVAGTAAGGTPGTASGGGGFSSIGASTGLSDPTQALAAAGFSMTTGQNGQIQITDPGGNVTMFPAGTAPTAIASQLGLQGFTGGTNNPSASTGMTPTGTATGAAASGNPFSQFFQSPGYQFMMNQGTNAVQNASTNQGGPNSGNTLKALQSYGTGLANQNYQQYLGNYQQYISNLSGITGAGQNAAAQLGGFGQTAATNAGNALIGGANATAAGQVGSANALTGGINGISQNALLYSLLNNGGGGNASAAGYGTDTTSTF
jgi:hypothetical protein